jgi:hypothetical protein
VRAVESLANLWAPYFFRRLSVIAELDGLAGLGGLPAGTSLFDARDVHPRIWVNTLASLNSVSQRRRVETEMGRLFTGLNLKIYKLLKMCINTVIFPF